MITLDELIEALTRLPDFPEVEAANLYDIEKRAFSISGVSGYRKTTLFMIAMLFDRLARKLDGEQPQSGELYAAICDKAREALLVDEWRNGAPRLEELTDMSWVSKLLH